MYGDTFESVIADAAKTLAIVCDAANGRAYLRRLSEAEDREATSVSGDATE